MTSIFCLIMIDDGKLLCFENDSHVVIPQIRFEEEFNGLKEAKNFFISKTHFKLGKSSLDVIYEDSKNEFYIYSCIIDCNNGFNKQILLDNNKRIKHINFCTVFKQNWDPWSLRALKILEQCSSFENVIYFLKNIDSFSHFSKETESFIKEHFQSLTNIWQSDSPDLIFENKNEIIGIEDFSFDASFHDDKGSSAKIAEEKTLKSFDQNSNQLQSRSYHVDNSKENYFINFKATYEDHAKKTSKYLLNLEKYSNNRKTLFGFLVRDTTILGSYMYLNDKGIQAAYPFNILEVWEFIFRNNHVDFIIFSQKLENTTKAYLILKNDIDILMKENLVFDLETLDMVFMNDPTIMSFNLFIPFKK